LSIVIKSLIRCVLALLFLLFPLAIYLLFQDKEHGKTYGSVQRKEAGGDITLKEFGKDEFVGWERMIASWFENFILEDWIPAVLI
jgi:hypothetical protein